MAAQEKSTDQIVEFLKSAPIRIAVFGEFSCGKSTFLNALIGMEILSVAVEPTTAVPTYIRYARDFNIKVSRHNDGTLRLFEEDPPFWARFVGRENILNTLKKQQRSIRSFLSVWTKEGEKADQVSHISIELPLPWLKKGIELIDTPGTNVEFAQHQRYTEAVAEETDIAILLMDARNGGGKRTEFEFMNAVAKSVGKCLIVLNKMDTLDLDDRIELQEFVMQEAFPKHWNGTIFPQVVGLSSLPQMEPQLAAAFRNFIMTLEDMATRNRGEILLHRLKNPEKRLFAEAQKQEMEQNYSNAHRTFYALHDVLAAAGMDISPAIDGIERAERHLKSQVRAVNTLDERVNEAIKLEASNPDKALTILNNVLFELKKAKMADSEAEEAIGRLRKRIQDRDDARKKIETAVAVATKLVEKGDFVESANALQSILDLPRVAEYTPGEHTTFHKLVEDLVARRAAWAENELSEIVAEFEARKNQIDRGAVSHLSDKFAAIKQYIQNQQQAKTIEKDMNEYLYVVAQIEDLKGYPEDVIAAAACLKGYCVLQNAIDEKVAQFIREYVECELRQLSGDPTDLDVKGRKLSTYGECLAEISNRVKDLKEAWVKERIARLYPTREGLAEAEELKRYGILSADLEKKTNDLRNAYVEDQIAKMKAADGWSIVKLTAWTDDLKKLGVMIEKINKSLLAKKEEWVIRQLDIFSTNPRQIGEIAEDLRSHNVMLEAIAEWEHGYTKNYVKNQIEHISGTPEQIDDCAKQLLMYGILQDDIRQRARASKEEYIINEMRNFAKVCKSWLKATERANELKKHGVAKKQIAECLKSFKKEKPEYDDRFKWSNHPVVSLFASGVSIWPLYMFFQIGDAYGALLILFCMAILLFDFYIAAQDADSKNAIVIILWTSAVVFFIALFVSGSKGLLTIPVSLVTLHIAIYVIWLASLKKGERTKEVRKNGLENLAILFIIVVGTAFCFYLTAKESAQINNRRKVAQAKDAKARAELEKQEEQEREQQRALDVIHYYLHLSDGWMHQPCSYFSIAESLSGEFLSKYGYNTPLSSEVDDMRRQAAAHSCRLSSSD